MARPGDIVQLTLVGPSVSDMVGGVASVLWGVEGTSLVPLYHLLATSPPSDEPTYRRYGQTESDIQVDITGDVTLSVKVPPVEPGSYRIEREYRIGRGDDMIYVTVDGILEVVE